MAQPLSGDKAAWVSSFTGIKLTPPALGGGLLAGTSPSSSAPQLSLSPQIIHNAFKMGLEDGMKKSPPKFKIGEGPLSDAYYEGYTGKIGPSPQSQPAVPMAGSDEWFNQGLGDGIGRRRLQVMTDPKQKASYQKGYDIGWPPLLRLPPGSAPAGPDAAPAGKADDVKKTEKDRPEVAVVTDLAHKDPKDRKVTTEVTYSLALRAVDESNPPVVQVLPNAEITVSMDASGKSPDIEAKINVIKADITKAVKAAVNLKGKVQIEATVGVSSKLDTAAAGAGQFTAALQTKIKGELSISILKSVTVKAGVETGPDGKKEVGVTIEVPLPKFLQ